MGSNLSKTFKNLLQQALPNYSLIEEYYIFYNNTKLFFDFYLPDLKLMIEVQGNQHFTFSKFFFKLGNEFNKQKVRDSLKEEWCSVTKHKLLTFSNQDIKMLTVAKLRSKIIGIL